ncbi:MAG TPA: M20/M25/M40 family metallo-hydrolase [Steroidobacteraceae bacterium]|nr:M20/M25/M40 family metallo-hydrolase [Steroidobacteraceae bacterium]
MRGLASLAAAAAMAGVAAAPAFAGTAPDFAVLSRIAAVSGYEQQLSAAIAQQLREQGLHPRTDNMYDVLVTVGHGSPHRLIAAAIDQPGYVVSGIDAKGYLRVQRLPQREPNPVFDTLEFAQPVHVVTPNGLLNGGFAGLSIHLAPDHLNPPSMTTVGNLYVDIGATSAAEARAAGADNLEPVALAQPPITVGADDEAGASAGDRFGWEALLEAAQGLAHAHAHGTITIAFVTQQWLGGRGLERVMTEVPASEMVFVGRISPPVAGKGGTAASPLPGEGVVVGTTSTPPGGNGLPDELLSLARSHHIAARAIAARPPVIFGFGPKTALPLRLAVVGVPTLYPVTPAETFSRSDLRKLTRLIEDYLREPVTPMSAAEDPFDAASAPGPGMTQPVLDQSRAPDEHVLKTLETMTTAYGASEHEQGARAAILQRLPAWARRRAHVDPAGNLVLHIGHAVPGVHAPTILFDAHSDEIGYQVTDIKRDGDLVVRELGGFYGRYYLGHVMLVHLPDGRSIGAALGLPSGWDRPAFKWPPALSTLNQPADAYVGTDSRAATEALGIHVGDFLTMPKVYRPLLGSHFEIRSIDDRAGDTALIEAVRALGPDFARQHPGRQLTFLWATREELGLEGAAAYAARVAKLGREPDVVFAVDMFVSSQSPLETGRYGDQPLGDGFVVRAVDLSHVDSPADVARVLALARAHHIPVQYGVTGGGNDSAVYTRYGTNAIALGWPTKYSHSPAEQSDTKDVYGLGRICTVLAKDW